MPLRNPPSPMPMPIDPGRCFEISSMRPLRCVKVQPQGSTNSGLKTSFFPWIAQPYLFAYRFSLGPSFDAPKGPLSFISCWIMMDTCPPMPIYRMGKDMTSRLPEKYLSLQVLLWPWIADTTITSFSRTGQRTEYSL